MSDVPEVPKFLTVAEAAVVLKVSPRTMERAIARGAVKAVKIGRYPRVPLSELQRLAGGH